jgi:peptidoglycan/LPS O-acetylase OafA/YrhL
VSIAIVFVAHIGYGDVVPGGFGVTVFFFLSGYLITTLLRREFASNGRIDYRAFYWRRAWRIFPPMYASLAFGLAVALAGITKVEPQFWPVVGQALHLTNYWSIAASTEGMPAGTTVMWSLAVEEHFYLLFPACAVFLMRRFTPRHQALTLLVTCLAVLAWRIVLIVGLDASSDRVYLGTDTRIDAILAGCIMGLYLNPALDRVPIPRLAMRTAIVGASVLAIGATLVVQNADFDQTLRYSIQTFALAPIFYFAIARPGDWMFRILNDRRVAFIGVLSYSLYLVHQIVIFSITMNAPDLSPFLVGVIAGPISLALAYASYRWVEQPATRFRKRHAVPAR